MSAGKTFAVISQGCAANFGDGERIARALAAQHEGCKILFRLPEIAAGKAPDCACQDAPGFLSQDAPDAIYLNVCTVKGNAGALKLLRTTYERFPSVPLFITGCAPKDFREEAMKVAPQVKFTSLKEIVTLEQGEAAAIESVDAIALTGSSITTRTKTVTLEPRSGDRVHGTLRESPYVGIVNIEEGCLDACAFCSTHLVKGRLHSYAPEAIEQQVRDLVQDGCVEIQLTGQDCACYGFDIGTNLAELTQRILAQVPGNYRLRLGMGNPRHILQYADALCECFQDERVYKFVHIPVQSGSDNVLKAMNRRHTAEDFRRLADMFNTRFPQFTLSTDLIVGFPGETPEDFQATLRLLRETRPTVCNITRFVAKPGTPAAKLEADPAHRIPDNIKHERSAILAEAFQQIAEENNRKWIGQTCKVVTEKSGYRNGTTIARNEAYRPVAIEGNIPAGTRLSVRIAGAEPFAILGEVL